ncbi:MAG: type II toxin-antitoxin system ParD family antitoxin [Kiloniellales bacterium]|nr:type II toxin-antitoxin system ParD family antitoxin [Kiloniellales bacterium]
MPTRNVVLTDRQEAFVSELVASGRYQNASEVLRDGLRLLEGEMERREAELAEIRAGIVEGLGQVTRGEFAEGSGPEAIDRAFDRAIKNRSR